MAVYIVREHGKKSFYVFVNFAGETVFNAFSNHRSLFAGDGEHVCLHVRLDDLAKRDIEILAWPVSVEGRNVAIFQEVYG